MFATARTLPKASRFCSPTFLTLTAWLWLFFPLLWMWPNARSGSEAVLSAALLAGLLLTRFTAQLASTLLWLLGLCFLGYFFAVHSLPDEFFWQSVLGSNAGEAWEYVQSYRPLDTALLLAWAIPAGAAVMHLWRQPQPLRQRYLRIWAWSTLVLWAIWIAVGLSKGYDVYRIVSRVDRIYPLMMVKSWERYEHNAQFAAQAAPAPPPEERPMVDVLLVVLGESASAHRWSLLGYKGNPTNAPLTPFESGLLALPVTTNGNNTGMTLPVIVAGQSLQAPSSEGLTSYLARARAAGFTNHVFANQQAPGFANVALRLNSERHLQLQDGRVDGELTPLLLQSLQTYADKAQPLVVTLHTYGSHPRVEKRYPVHAAKWADPYDNSIHYTSQLMAEWLQALNALPTQRVAMVYVSDHGQDFPICGGSYTHGITRSTYEVPFLLWGNARLRAEQPLWWQSWNALAAQAVDHQGVPRMNTLLSAQAIEQLLGYARPTTSLRPSLPNSNYPPQEDASLCNDWSAQVRQLHPAAH